MQYLVFLREYFYYMPNPKPNLNSKDYKQIILFNYIIYFMYYYWM